MPDSNPYASPAPIPHDAPKPAHPLEPLLGPSLGLLLSSGIEIVFSLFLLPQFVHEVMKPNPDLSGALVIPMFAASFPIFIGAWQMRCGTRYRWAYAAAALTCIPLLTPGMWCGAPLGIWALVVLHRKDIKAVFADRAAEITSREKRQLE